MSKTYFLIKLQKKRKPDFTIISHNIGGQSAIWEKNSEYKYYLSNDRGTFDGNFENWNKTDIDKLTTHLNKFNQNNTFFLIQEYREESKKTGPDLDTFYNFRRPHLKPIPSLFDEGYGLIDPDPLTKRPYNPVINAINEICLTNTKLNNKKMYLNMGLDDITDYTNVDDKKIYNNISLNYFKKIFQSAKQNTKERLNINKTVIYYQEVYIINIHGIIINDTTYINKIFENLIIYEIIKKFIDKYEYVIIAGDFNTDLHKLKTDTNYKDQLIKSIKNIYKQENNKMINFIPHRNRSSNNKIKDEKIDIFSKNYVDYHFRQLQFIFEKCSYGEEKYNMSGSFTNAWTLNHPNEDKTTKTTGIKKNVDYILVSNKLKEKYDLKWTIDTSMVYTKEEQIKKVDVEPYVNDFDHAVVKLEMFKK